MTRHWFRLAAVVAGRPYSYFVVRISTIPHLSEQVHNFSDHKISFFNRVSHAAYAIFHASAPVSTLRFPLEPHQIRLSFLLRAHISEASCFLFFGQTLPLVRSGICCGPSPSQCSGPVFTTLLRQVSVAIKPPFCYTNSAILTCVRPFWLHPFQFDLSQASSPLQE